MRALLAAVLALALLVVLAPPAQPWGNGTGSNPDFRYYGVHDAVAHLALEKLLARDAEAAAWLQHWYLPNPGGYGASFNPANLRPTGADNLLGYTDEPDSEFQDWCNHLYMVHPRAGEDEQCAPAHVAKMMDWTVANLTLSIALGSVPCNPFEHMAAYNAGVMAHYVGDLSQWGHTDGTRKDHSHPPFDPEDRTYHGYYESAVWGTNGLRALQADQRSRPWQPDVVADPEAAVRALAVRTNMPDGVTVSYTDLGGQVVQVGSMYRTMLTGYVAAYDAGQSYLGMRGFTAPRFAQAMDHVGASVDLVADLWHTAGVRAREVALGVTLPPSPALLPGC